MANVAVCDIDAGTATLEERGDIATKSTRTVRSIEEVLWKFAQKDPVVAHIHTLALDGGSEAQKRDLADIAAAGAQSKKTRDQDLNELADYKLNKSRLLRVFRMARDIEGVTLVITAWAKKTLPKIPGTNQTNKDALPTSIVPDFTDGVSDTLRGYCDDVWYYFYDEQTKTRKLVTANYGPVVAKTRNAKFAANMGYTDKETGAFIPVVDNPTFPDIVARYKKAF